MTYRALARTPTGTFAVVHRPEEAPGTTALAITPLVVGLCGTDLQIARGLRPDTAAILGHEGVARVSAPAARHGWPRAGQLVVINPVSQRNQDHIIGHSIDGLLQDHMSVSDVQLEQGLLAPFDTTIPLAYGPLIEPLGTVIYGTELVRGTHTPEHVAIAGAGPFGLLCALLEKLQSHARVTVIHNQPERMAWACERGILTPEECVLDTQLLSDQLLERTHSVGIDTLYVCTPRPASVSLLQRVLPAMRHGAVIDLVGGFRDGDHIDELPDVDLNQVRRANHCGTPTPGIVTNHRSTQGIDVRLTGHRGTSADHLRHAQDLLRQHGSYFGRVISHIVSLHAAGDFLQRFARTGERTLAGDTCVKAIVDMRLSGPHIRRFDSEITDLR